MTVDVARRGRRRAPAKSADPEPPGETDVPGALSGTLGSGSARRATASVSEPPSIAPTGSFRAATSFAPPPSSAPTAAFLSAASMAIGEIDQTIFDCPSCARPLALGTRRCPGCKTRLLNGIQLGKASIFITAGVAAGLLLGSGAAFLLASGHGAVAGPLVAGASAAPSTASARPGASVRPTKTPATPAPTNGSGLPPLTQSALVQIVAANGRLTTAAGDLHGALRAKDFDASAVAQILRSVSADSVFGQQLAGRVAGWSDTAQLGTQLETFYRTIHETAGDALVASVRNKAAYRAAAVAMVKLLDAAPTMDAAVRSAAEAAGVDLPNPSPAP